MNQPRAVEVGHQIFHHLFKNNLILFPCKNLNHLKTQLVLIKVVCLEVAHLIVLSKDNQVHVSKASNQIKNQIIHQISSSLHLIIDFTILSIKKTQVRLHKKP